MSALWLIVKGLGLILGGYLVGRLLGLALQFDSVAREVAGIRKEMATKGAIDRTFGSLKHGSNEIQQEVAAIRQEMATKDDLRELEERIRESVGNSPAKEKPT